MEINNFDPASSELLKGINLIEASAGTGKTYTIAMLVLRFVVEREIPIQRLLLVTFTNAATQELKDRVRTKLAEARQATSGFTYAADPSILAWLACLNIEVELIKQRLDTALLNIDQAGIFTIHGFCQRVLSEHALESGQLFDAELLGDLREIKQNCADDFWRREIYPRTVWEVSVLTVDYKTPDALLASVDRVGSEIRIFPPLECLDQALKQIRDLVIAAQETLESCRLTLEAHFMDDKFKSSYIESFNPYFRELSAWLRGDSVQMPAAESLALLTENGLYNALNGNKFRANKTQSAEQRKAEYLAELNIETTAFDDLACAVKQISLLFRRALLETLHCQLDKQLQQLNMLSFDSLISRLAETLGSDKAEPLIAELQLRFAAALIDEFQDTDYSQWAIFSSIFSTANHYLYLIGDPKQAIYKFRGADIYAYLSAQKQAQHRFTLGKNWRSQPQLVEAVNTLFQRQQAFLLPELAFNPIKPALSAKDGVLCKARTALAPMMLWQLPESNSKSGFWRTGSKEAAQEIIIETVKEIIDLLTGDYSIEPAKRALKPRDIAILVRSNSQARDYQAVLRAAGVPSLLNSTESVFASSEAADLFSLLQAVAVPGNIRFLKQALTLDWFGLNGQKLYQLSNDESQLDAWTGHFNCYLQDWQQHGLMAMMQRLLMQEKLTANIAKTQLADRQLTNLHHLTELIQQAAIDGHLGIHKTLDWLRLAIIKALQNPTSAEDQQLRLESDDDAVQIVTMHRSKGLEYAIVFCPCLWQRSQRLQSEKELIICHEEGRMIADLGSANFEQRRTQALREELAEDLRILYVALTRAKNRCYVAWVDARTEAADNNSAFAWLLDFAGADFSRQQSVLHAFKQKAPEAFDYKLLEIPGEINTNYQKSFAKTRLNVNPRQRQLFTNWQMSSYTALSALSLQETPELPEDKADEKQLIEIETTELALPKGAHTGNVIHDLMENITFTDLASQQNIAGPRDKVCQRYGLKLNRPELIDELLQTVVTTPLSETDTSFRLNNIPENQCLKEMPFYLSMSTMDASRINKILASVSTYQPLNSKTMCGFLTGFIDLVCEYKGLYYVIDYKTNLLSDYGEASLIQAMKEHNYGLQYWLYALVLHLYLQKRLPDYRYEQHFGGVRYLFVRGMQPERPMRGIYQDRPDLKRIQSLAAVFGISEC